MNNPETLINQKKESGFRDKVVVITGSSKGIGKVTALEFLKAGAKVVLNGRDPDILGRTARELEQMGYKPLEIAGDMSDFITCGELIKRTLEHFGKIDILINNAGGGFRGKIEETAPDVFRKVIAANLMTAVYCTIAALEHIKKTKGSIVFISSLSGLRGLPYNGPYCVAKMGLTAFAQTLKLELYGTGVHIGIIMVGITDFDKDKKVVSADGSLIPINRKFHQTKEQVAKKILMVIRKRKFELILTKLGKMNAFFQRISPSFVEWVIRNSRHTKEYNQ